MEEEERSSASQACPSAQGDQGDTHEGREAGTGRHRGQAAGTGAAGGHARENHPREVRAAAQLRQ